MFLLPLWIYKYNDIIITISLETRNLNGVLEFMNTSP